MIQRPLAVDDLRAVAELGGQLGFGPGKDDAAVARGDGAVLDDAEAGRAVGAASPGGHCARCASVPIWVCCGPS